MNRIRNGLLLVALVVAGVAGARDTQPKDGGKSRPRISVHAFKTADSFVLPEKRQQDADARSVALGKSYLVARLARPGHPFVVTEDEKSATHVLEPVISFLRSRENTFKGTTYGVETKTTKWTLDVILTLRNRVTGDIAWAKSVSGSCDEQRPISASQFDNNIFHSLMISAVEEAAEALVDSFEPRDEETVAAASVSTSDSTGGSVRPVRSADVGVGRPALAILRPDFRDGVTENEAVILWGYLESAVEGGAYRVISRADVARQMEEVAVTTSSYLTDPTCREKARVGKLATVSKLLAASVGRIGGTYVMTFKVFDASTAEIEASRTGSVTAESLGALLPLIRGEMAKVLRPAPAGTVLLPVELRLSNPPKGLADDFNACLETVLSEAGISCVPGREGTRRLVPTVTSFSVRAVADDGGFVYRGTVSFALAVTDAEGRALAAPVAVALSDIELGRETGAAPSWLTAQYGRRLLARAFADLPRRLGAVLEK